MLHTINLPTPDGDDGGGYVDLSLPVLNKIDKRFRHILYSMRGIKGASSVAAYFQIQEILGSGLIASK